VIHQGFSKYLEQLLHIPGFDMGHYLPELFSSA